MVCTPFKYVPADIVLSVDCGLYVVAFCVVTGTLKTMLVVPLVPLDTYPPDTVGVPVADPWTDIVLLIAPAIVPDPVRLDGIVADPAETVAVS